MTAFLLAVAQAEIHLHRVWSLDLGSLITISPTHNKQTGQQASQPTSQPASKPTSQQASQPASQLN